MNAKQLTILIITTILLFGFTKNKPTSNYTPPGTVKIGSHFFMDATEISNISWMEYMYWNESTFGKSSKEYLSSLPDTSVWDEPFSSHYLSHPAYRDYPVVGVSWQQANSYSKWRSERVMEHIEALRLEHPKRIYPSKINYRLPTLAEWELVANANYSEKTQRKLAKKYTECNKHNFKSNKENTPNTTAPVFQYWPNEYGVYNIMGNVAEMITKKEISKGGSWEDFENDVSVSKNFKYTTPQKWVGFRCVCEVVF